MRLFQLLLCLFFAAHLSAQQDSIPTLNTKLLEELLENNDEQSFDFASLYEELQTYVTSPLNVNKAEAEDFANLGIMTETQVEDIISYREKYGNFVSIYELQAVPTMDVSTLSALKPFITVGNSGKTKSFRYLMTQAQNNVFLKYKRVLQRKAGYDKPFDKSGYLGDQNHYFMRFHRFSGQNLRIGFTAEKDPGEGFFQNNSGFDFYSGFIYMRDVHPLFSSINVGDFSVSMGQGLVMHNSFGGGKSSYVMNVKKGGRAIKPYSSVNESNYMRGIATTMSIGKNIKTTVFGSVKKVDGSGIQQDTTIDTGFSQFSSINLSGLHRTQTEIDKKANVRQANAGLSTYYKNRTFKVGLNALYTHFNIPIGEKNKLYQKYYFTGDQLLNTSIDYSYRYRNFSVFGETAMSDNKGLATINGLLISMGRNVDGAIVYRNYAKDYQVLNANAFGESTLPINERGIYFGLKFKPLHEITISTYYDIWEHPWVRFSKNGLTGGKEFLVKFDYYKKRKYNVYLQYRYEQKEENSSLKLTKIKPLANIHQHRVRLHLSYKLNKDIELRNRAEYAYYTKDKTTSNGYLLYQDVIYKPIGKPYSFTARYALFDTYGYDGDGNRTSGFKSRIYAYENDILYEFSIPFYSGRGSRFYINTRYNITRNITGEIHYGYRYLYDNKTIGSGNEQIIGNRRSDLKLQVKLKF